MSYLCLAPIRALPWWAGRLLIGIQEKVSFPLGAKLRDESWEMGARWAEGSKEACLEEWS